jgi:hypothetical protein
VLDGRPQGMTKEQWEELDRINDRAIQPTGKCDYCERPMYSQSYDRLCNPCRRELYA